MLKLLAAVTGFTFFSFGRSLVKQLAAVSGIFTVLDVYSWKAATTTSSFFAAQETDSSELIMERYQAMLAGVVTFSFYDLW